MVVQRQRWCRSHRGHLCRPRYAVSESQAKSLTQKFGVTTLQTRSLYNGPGMRFQRSTLIGRFKSLSLTASSEGLGDCLPSPADDAECLLFRKNC